MKKHFISHRGNISQKLPHLENNPEYVQKALEAGYEVEVDVWYLENKWFLGHDETKYEINIDFLINKKIWSHAKNIEALEMMLKNKKIHCFWHQNDEFTLTSKGFIWTYPNNLLTSRSICVLPEWHDQNPENAIGICSDNIEKYKNLFL